MRYQMVDGENRGTVGAIQAIAMRLDHRDHRSSSGMGRGWGNVTVDMADRDLATLGSDFSRNATSTPTQVFRGSTNWPAVSGSPLTRAARWGGRPGAYRFLLSRAWL